MRFLCVILCETRNILTAFLFQLFLCGFPLQRCAIVFTWLETCAWRDKTSRNFACNLCLCCEQQIKIDTGIFPIVHTRAALLSLMVFVVFEQHSLFVLVHRSNGNGMRTRDFAYSFFEAHLFFIPLTAFLTTELQSFQRASQEFI